MQKYPHVMMNRYLKYLQGKNTKMFGCDDKLSFKMSACKNKKSTNMFKWDDESHHLKYYVKRKKYWGINIVP